MDHIEETKTVETLPVKTKKPLTVSWGVMALCLILASLFVFMATYISVSLSARRLVNEAYADAARYEKLLEIAGLYDSEYYYEFDDEEAADRIAALYGTAVGDPYSSYYTAEEWLLESAASGGNAVGIGVYVVMSDEGYIQIARVMSNSPAATAGLREGDLITAVDGQNVKEIGYEAAVDLVLGEVGSTVSFKVLRDGDPWEIHVTRGLYDPQTVFAETVTTNGELFGYLHIVQFSGTTPTQFKTAMEKLIELGVKGFIFDVRDNPGGDLDAIVSILDYLLPEGPIVHIVGKEEHQNKTYTSDASAIDLPMVVLTNDGTASAAELFTSALLDYKKAVTVGETTYGKGCGQEGMYLSDGSVVFITTFLYNPPYSENYDGIGIPATYEVELPEEYRNINLMLVAHDNDTQLKKGLEVLFECVTNP